jgi:REP element-mobilizing transposase RayT
MDAWVLLPNCMHCVWTLPQGDDDLSICWSLIKSLFSKETKGLYYIPESDEGFETKALEDNNLAEKVLGASDPG